MTQEDKEILLKDLTARLLYRVKGIITYDKSNTAFTVEGIDNNVLHLSDAEECYVEDFKPYLRPMSSMTEDEKEEYCNLQDKFLCSSQYPVTDAYELFDWLNVIPQEILYGEYIFNITEGCDNRWALTYNHCENRRCSYYGLSSGADNLIDACVEMILKLHKLNLL